MTPAILPAQPDPKKSKAQRTKKDEDFIIAILNCNSHATNSFFIHIFICNINELYSPQSSPPSNSIKTDALYVNSLTENIGRFDRFFIKFWPLSHIFEIDFFVETLGWKVGSTNQKKK